MSHVIDVGIDQFLKYRRERALPFFYKNISSQIVELTLQASESLLMRAKADSSDPDVIKALDYANVPVSLFDNRINTHDFGDSSTWTDPNDSTFSFAPATGRMMFLTYTQVRFPRTINLTSSNKLVFVIQKWIEALQSLQDVVIYEYSSIEELIKKTNEPVYTTLDTIPAFSNDKLIELRFLYANPWTLEGTPIILCGDKGENIRVYLDQHTPLLDINDNPLSGPAWTVFNGKEVDIY